MNFRRSFTPGLALASILSLLDRPVLQAGGLTGADLQEVVVTGRRITLTGEPRAASEGTVLAAQLNTRPLLRVGEMLEVVPGLIVTQHTGDGKANQYFLRGFNLDHGTDFLTRVEGMPVNLGTHAHGQGYLDVNFVIPELIERVVYRKGTYYPELGNFSAAGAADLYYRDTSGWFVNLGRGDNNYQRAVLGGATRIADGYLLLGLEHDRSDGPWLLPQDLAKTNALLRWSETHEDRQYSIAAMGYRSDWRATDQIPLRAVRDGSLDRYGFIDPTSGGETHRYSLSGQGDWQTERNRFAWTAYVLDYHLQLFSNFTYALDPDQGDQFEQYDDRRAIGGSVNWTRPVPVAAGALNWHSGLEYRQDDIAPVGLHLTRERERYRTIREDRVRQHMIGAWARLAYQPLPWLRLDGGLRTDRYTFDVQSNLAANSARAHDTLTSPKFSLVIGPWHDTELFIAKGRGFHSNDARGGTTRVDPLDGVTPVEPVTPLARADGSEIGLRTALLPRTQVSLALWRLNLDSELLFIGDGGTTEATRPSRREGVELGLYAQPYNWLIIDADYAWSKARFRDVDPTGTRIPGAVETAASLGVAVDLASGWFGGLRLRHLGAAPLIEDGSVRSRPSTLVNLQAGKRFSERLSVAVGLYNALDARANDISYFYESQLATEDSPVEDIHFHPVEPRSLRFNVRVDF
jgi:hypothetical protein